MLGPWKVVVQVCAGIEQTLQVGGMTLAKETGGEEHKTVLSTLLEEKIKTSKLNHKIYFH